MFLVQQIAFDGMIHQHRVDENTPVVDLLIQKVERLFILGDRIAPELLPDLALRLHVPNAIRLEAPPFFGIMLREVAPPLPVGLRGLAGEGEVTNEVGTLLELFPLDVQYLAHTLQRQRERQHG
ncbi:hypothetical protein SDC9_204018 [bioreactor metagenome]|uniref:Uncharacterized protein n=1 Tax=bioreactor metagenome TaxID=1076179 RepID=A0A645IZJ9_9ZZZZ